MSLGRGSDIIPQNEITNFRPSNYSVWHRNNLPKDCFMTDGDWFEQRKDKYGNLKAVAYIETVQIPDNAHPYEYPIWTSKKYLAKEIELKMKVSSYFVWHTPDCNTFFVQDIFGMEPPHKMNADKYKEWLKGLK